MKRDDLPPGMERHGAQYRTRKTIDGKRVSVWLGSDLDAALMNYKRWKLFEKARKYTIDSLLSMRQPKHDNWNDQCSGVYFLFTGNECVYIGQSVNVAWRIEQHKKQKLFDSFAIIPVPINDQGLTMREIEAFYIQKIRPRLNVKGIM